ncbi:MAG: hypothetical protein MZU91_13035 [Desulfosudis oleivorans]|nr:hypothetical protein [Desulfosudis oleivorans]
MPEGVLFRGGPDCRRCARSCWSSSRSAHHPVAAGRLLPALHRRQDQRGLLRPHGGWLGAPTRSGTTTSPTTALN